MLLLALGVVTEGRNVTRTSRRLQDRQPCQQPSANRTALILDHNGAAEAAECAHDGSLLEVAGEGLIVDGGEGKESDKTEGQSKLSVLSTIAAGSKGLSLFIVLVIFRLLASG